MINLCFIHFLKSINDNCSSYLTLNLLLKKKFVVNASLFSLVNTIFLKYVPVKLGKIQIF